MLQNPSSIFSDIKKVRPEKLRQWLQSIEDSWRVIPELEVPSGSLNSLAIICDGNRRAAQERGMSSFLGHRAGVETIKGVARACRKWDIKHLTLWIWSTENWKRDREQVKYVMSLAASVLADPRFKQELIENEVRFIHLGRKDRLPKPVLGVLTQLEEETRGFDQFWMNLAMDYGGLDETARATAEMMRQALSGKLKPADVESSPELIFDFLDTQGQPLPDLIVRTGTKEGEIPHTSGLMPLQSVHACWEFAGELFPDLTPSLLQRSVVSFMEYERRFGK